MGVKFWVGGGEGRQGPAVPASVRLWGSAGLGAFVWSRVRKR